MKICHVITRMIVGGAQENTLLSCRGAVEAGHDVTLVTGPSPGPEGELLKRASCPGLKIVECPHLVRAISPLTDLKAYSFLKKLFREEKYDVVHTHSSKAGIVGRFAAKAAHVPFVAHTIHGLAFHRYEKFWKNFIYIASERAAAPCGKRIYAVAQAMIDQSLAAGVGKPEQYKVVYSGMELEPFLTSKPDPELRKSLGIPEDAFVCGISARLEEYKGHRYLLESAKIVTEKHPNTYFLIIGGGSEERNLRNLVIHLGISTKVIFTGFVNDVAPYYNIMNLNLNCSIGTETSSLALSEGMSLSISAIATTYGGNPYMITDGVNGFLVPERDPAAMAERICEIIENPSLYAQLSKGAYEMYEKKFTASAMTRQLEELYVKSYVKHVEK